MIEFVKGDITKSDTEIVTNAVNTKGISGAGVALAFKRAFPDNFRAYRKYCEESLLKPGKLFVYIQKRDQMGPTTIVNFATKDHWRNDSRIEWIKFGLEDLRRFIIDGQYCSIAIPKLGCGLGGLNWEDQVKPLVIELAESLPKVRFKIYE